ncbi:MAG: (2Fe-2S)-binding protein [Deltaproteobacteria bacterium]|nr:(2Fe-2S)-binding protein [Deltaproteobacteria bacterium]
MGKQFLTMTVNGETVEVAVEPSAMLIDVLRDQLDMIGTKEACREGECGACTVILEGMTVNSCITPAMKAQGRSVLTIEGVDDQGKLHPIQEAFIEKGAIQCGYCTPGMVLSVKVLLDENPNPLEEEVKMGLSGNLCRCTGYIKIIDAVMVAARQMGQ